MSVEQEDISQYIPKKNAYGALIRERGTRRILVGAAVVFAAYLIYGQVRNQILSNADWPSLSADPKGLTVLGLIPEKYKAYEVNKDWQIRRPEDAEEEAENPEAAEMPELKDRGGASPGAGRGEKGAIVPVEEIMKTCPVVLTGKHFSSAHVQYTGSDMFDRKIYKLHLNLTDEGSSRYWQYSRGRDDQRLVFVLDGDIISCPRMNHMKVTTLEIDPIWVEADANKLADFINGRK